MDKVFERMLAKAEEIRNEQRRLFKFSPSHSSPAPHASQMAEMIRYGQKQGLFSGVIHKGTASEEYLSQVAEAAAFILEFFHGEDIGPVLDLTSEEKIQIALRAEEKAKDVVSATRTFGC